MAEEGVELGALAESVATGIIVMAEEVSGEVEFTEEDRMDMEELVDALVEVAVVAAEGGGDYGVAGQVVTEFLEANPEIANVAAEVGAALLAEGEDGGDEEASDPAGDGNGGPPTGPVDEPEE